MISGIECLFIKVNVIWVIHIKLTLNIIQWATFMMHIENFDCKICVLK